MLNIELINNIIDNCKMITHQCKPITSPNYNGGYTIQYASYYYSMRIAMIACVRMLYSLGFISDNAMCFIDVHELTEDSESCIIEEELSESLLSLLEVYSPIIGWNVLEWDADLMLEAISEELGIKEYDISENYEQMIAFLDTQKFEELFFYQLKDKQYIDVCKGLCRCMLDNDMAYLKLYCFENESLGRVLTYLEQHPKYKTLQQVVSLYDVIQQEGFILPIQRVVDGQHEYGINTYDPNMYYIVSSVYRFSGCDDQVLENLINPSHVVLCGLINCLIKELEDIIPEIKRVEL